MLAPDQGAPSAWILASFRNARVLEPFPCRGGAQGARWRRIIGAHERTLAFLGGRPGARPLDDAGLRQLGDDLFEALLPGDVRRLYDTARSLQPAGVLHVALTSMVHWVADKPWELARDPARREFLATSCVNLVRNVFTSVPADAPGRTSRRLRVLVVSARPRGAAPLGVEQETAALREAFRPLVRARLAAVEVLPRATRGGAAEAARRRARRRAALRRSRRVRPRDARGIDPARGRARPPPSGRLRRVPPDRLPPRAAARLPERVRDGPRRPPRLEPGHGSGARRGRRARGGGEPVPRARHGGHDLRGRAVRGPRPRARARRRGSRGAPRGVAREGDGLEWAIPVVFARDAREPLR